jgi:hypothetical protein
MRDGRKAGKGNRAIKSRRPPTDRGRGWERCFFDAYLALSIKYTAFCLFRPSPRTAKSTENTEGDVRCPRGRPSLRPPSATEVSVPAPPVAGEGAGSVGGVRCGERPRQLGMTCRRSAPALHPREAVTRRSPRVRWQVQLWNIAPWRSSILASIPYFST